MTSNPQLDDLFSELASSVLAILASLTRSGTWLRSSNVS